MRLGVKPMAILSESRRDASRTYPMLPSIGLGFILKVRSTVSRRVASGALRLIVDSGDGSGFYEPGDEIPVAAAQAEHDYFFSHWSSTAGTAPFCWW